jgi:hypothetical protein
MKVLAVMDETNEHSVSGGAPVASLSTRQSKRHRCYVNRDCEAVHFRLRHDYFDDDYVYPVILLPEVSYVDVSFLKHYA